MMTSQNLIYLKIHRIPGISNLQRLNIFKDRFKKLLNVQPKYMHSATVFFLHGLGDSGRAVRGWMEPFINRPNMSHIRFVFPTAPFIHYKPYNEKLRAWFNKYDLSPSSKEHSESLDSIRVVMENLIASEVSSGISVNRIVVGGFSMGGALAMHVGYRWAPDVAGVFALSASLQKNSSVYDALNELNNPAPLIMCHGDSDDVIDLELAERTYAKLTQLGIDGNFYVIPGMEHDVQDEQIEDLLHWIRNILPP